MGPTKCLSITVTSASIQVSTYQHEWVYFLHKGHVSMFDFKWLYIYTACTSAWLYSMHSTLVLQVASQKVSCVWQSKTLNPTMWKVAQKFITVESGGPYATMDGTLTMLMPCASSWDFLALTKPAALHRVVAQAGCGWRTCSVISQTIGFPRIVMSPLGGPPVTTLRMQGCAANVSCSMWMQHSWEKSAVICRVFLNAKGFIATTSVHSAMLLFCVHELRHVL